MTRKIFAAALIVLALFTAGSFFMFHTRKEKKKQQLAAQPRNQDYFKRLESYADFVAMQGEPLSNKFNNVQSVKVVYDLHDKTLYFINASRYHYHMDFCRLVLGDEEPLELFNVRNYGNTAQRDYVLANLNYYVQSRIYALEFSSIDEVSVPQVEAIFGAVRSNASMGDSLRLLVGSGRLAALDKEGKITLPKVYVSDIYSRQQYQELNGGTAIGILRKIEDIEEDYSSVQPEDIIIIKGTPVNVPVCAGIITDIYQTPLSHISILCHNRNIPSAADLNIWRCDSLDQYLNKPVRLLVGEDRIVVVPATTEELQQFRESRSAKKITQLKSNTGVRTLQPLASIDYDDKTTVGNKAAGLGVLARVARRNPKIFSVPEGGFAIPFYYYQQHIARASVRREIEALNTDPLYARDRKAAKEQLKKIRKAIKEEPVSPELLQQVASVIRSNQAGNSYRFRSSSNAEDREGFSGAGLYDSKTGILGDTAKSIDKAIRAVWASTWNEEAYRECMSAGVDPNSVMMGILVHRNFPDEAANGVAITSNIYRPGFPGYTINVQVGEASVVSPDDSVTCEQFVCMNSSSINPMSGGFSIDYLTYSSINGGKPVLTPDQARQLHRALEKVKQYFFNNIGRHDFSEYNNYALDIEFKFDRNGKLYLKQARPYH